MYCKKCGKQISDDSVYCQYCGTPQNNDTKGIGRNRPQSVINLSNMAPKQKLWIGIYLTWFILNLAFVLIEGDYYYGYAAHSYFFPFEKCDLGVYDLSEFIVYSALLPLLIIIIYQVSKRHSSNNSQKDNM